MYKYEAGGSGREELKKWPPPSPAVLWFVNGREENPDRKKVKGRKVGNSLQLFTINFFEVSLLCDDYSSLNVVFDRWKGIFLKVDFH